MSHRFPKWMTLTLALAGLYNLIFGLVTIAAPNLLFNLAGATPPLYPAIWQCVGMIVGVFGIGYLIAATNPIKHWSIILVGLLGKTFGPIGFLYAAFIADTIPPSFGFIIITNDLVWIAPFAAILFLTARQSQFQPKLATTNPPEPPESAMRAADDQFGITIYERSETMPTLVVFLRHFGCTFCRETLRDLEQQQHKLRQHDIDLVIVHMSDDAHARRTLLRYGLEHAPRIADPDQSLYRSFDLARGTLLQLFGPRAIWRAISATLQGNILGRLQGDSFQMPGVFLVEHGRIIHSLRHHHAGQRPDYVNLALEAIEPSELETYAKHSIPA